MPPTPDEIVRAKGDLVVRATRAMNDLGVLIAAIERSLDEDESKPSKSLRAIEKADKVLADIDRQVRLLRAMFGDVLEDEEPDAQPE